MRDKISRSIGIAGYMGSGKSTVSDFLRDRGAVVIDADIIAKQILNSCDDIKSRVAAVFGGDVVDCDVVNTGILGKRAFAARESMESLNRIIHPPLINEIRRRLLGAGTRPCVLDAALIPLWNIGGWFEALCWVEADFNTRLNRIERKLQIGSDEISHRMRLQESMFDRPEGSNWLIIHNDGAAGDIGKILMSAKFHPIMKLFNSKDTV